MVKLLVLVVFVGVVAVVAAVKEWKNFENGKVYSHKTPAEEKNMKIKDIHKIPLTEEKFLHSHHKEKKILKSLHQTAETKPVRKKNAERHHRKNVEEEMHLKPLNERHHKFPNPALLDMVQGSSPPPVLSSKNIVRQTKIRRQNSRRRSCRKQNCKDKRNRPGNTNSPQMDNNSEINPEDERVTLKPQIQTQASVYPNSKIKEPALDSENGFPLKLSSYW